MHGVQPEGDQPHPFIDPTIPLEEKPEAFLTWVSSYYNPIPDQSSITPESMRTRQATALVPTLRRLSLHDFQHYVEPAVTLGSGGAFIQSAPEIHQRNTRRTFLDADVAFPDVDILDLWCDESISLTVWSAKVIAELLQQEVTEGMRKRRVEILQIKGANHCVSTYKLRLFVLVMLIYL